MGDIRELVSESEQAELLSQARHVSAHAYCPYSGFAVGAAVLSRSRRIYVGCNVENAAYSPSLCAERNAIGAMVAAGEREALVVAVYTPTLCVTTPCGVCRQVLHEFSPELWLISGCNTEEVLSISLADIFPAAFGPRDLNIAKQP